jgi:hypothetical protein
MMPFMTISELITTLYQVISGPAGAPRDWELEKSLLHPSARMMRTGLDEDGKPWISIMDRESYQKDTTPYFEQNGFYEQEVSCQIERFGNIAHARSVYEARHDPADPVPFKRGVNSIQLYNDGNRWTILSVLWDNERDGLKIPQEWL